MVLRVCLIVTVAILAVSVLYAGSSPADAKDKVASRGSESPVAGGSGPNTVTFTLEEAKHALEYWTPKRMANATPMPLPQRSLGPRAILDQQLPPNSSSPPVRGAAPVSPSGHTNNGRLRQGAGPEAITPAEHANPAEWTGPLTSPPATTVGKLPGVWVNDPNNPNDDRATEGCSASTVDTPAKNLVLTAAHCVLYTPKEGDPWSERQWLRNVEFVPGYRDGAQPHGEWAAHTVVVPEEWAESGDLRYDVAAIQVWPSNLTGGELLVDEVGANGILFNEPAQQDAYVFGYPSNYANGEKLYYCHDRSEWGGFINPRPYVLCDFGPGSSGGPWLMNFNGETGDLFSVTSTECEEGQI
jgi:V8-like Glu-specific endopeptidase